jgi:hypothetical protein
MHAHKPSNTLKLRLPWRRSPAQPARPPAPDVGLLNGEIISIALPVSRRPPAALPGMWGASAAAASSAVQYHVTLMHKRIVQSLTAPRQQQAGGQEGGVMRCWPIITLQARAAALLALLCTAP